MNKYFIFSDCHGFYNELMNALNKAGFDINNQEHHIIFCGDALDRGNQPLEIFRFLQSIPKERRILIRGNHELLLKNLINRGYPMTHDYSNGTYDTIFELSNFKNEHEFLHIMFKEKLPHSDENFSIYSQEKQKIYNGVAREFVDWVDSNDWVNYLETDKYIFVHSWIPMLQEYENGHIVDIGYREDWKNATQTEWEDATWGCPWKKALNGYNKTNKTIICGHWHTSDFFNNLTKQHKTIYQNPIFKSKRYKLIGLDACTALTHKINVLVMNEDEL